ncbi:MAG: hypothetical protein E7435_02435 [Ruminococcaceae bacterium]|nr:hypothetical protein [Oscillospiraceae bacterium]
MVVYLDILLILNFFVDFFLLLGTNRLSGYPPSPRRAALAATLGAVYSGACFIPGFSFLGNTLWRTVSLGLMGGIAFGFRKSAVRRCVLFYLLSMALGGVALGLEGGNALTLIAAAGGVGALCVFGFRGKAGKQFLPVELTYGENRISLTALRDTGNSLRDPLTGQSVLVIGPEAAQSLTGLTREQLHDPASAISALPGLCLVPYRAVGKQGGLLLALRLKNVKIGSWAGKCTVAFAPEGLGGNGEYQALTGGSI